MKPLNHDDKGCNFTSSDCVIWQGPDIPCIKLCKGDSVSDVIFKLATELCAVMETLDIEQYDLSCLDITGCAPKNFHDFIQTIINLICQLQDCCNSQGGSGSRTTTVDLNTQIPVAPCFYYTNEFGDQVTTMTISQYVTAIGNRICNLENRMSSVETSIANNSSRISTIETELANPTPVVLPTVIPNCVLPANPTEMNVVLDALEQQFCELVGATGNPTDIYNAINQQCVGLNNSPVLGGGSGTMSGIAGWINTVANMAGAVNNIWLSICDLRAAILNIKLNCCPKGCEDIEINLTATLSGTNVTLFFTGNIPTGFTTCSPLGTLVTITDDNGALITAYVDIVLFMNNPTGYTISIASTPINPSSNLHIHMEPCLSNSSTNAVCQSCLDYTVINQLNCPSILYTPTVDTIAYTGASLVGTNTYDIQLWNNAGTAMIANQVQIVTSPNPVAGTFVGLIPNTIFKARVVVTSATGIVTSCPFVPVALDPYLVAPVNLGDAASFVALAGTGLNNGVASSFIGNVGTDGGAIVGIVALDVAGILYPVADPVVGAAQVGLTNAIADASTRTPVTTIPTVLDGLTYTTGVYDSASTNFTLGAGATVTLDAAGDPSVIFIFKMAGTLTIGNNASIVLANGALASNVFWQVNGIVTIGTGVTFKGTILSGSNVTIGTGTAIMNGRVLSKGTINSENDAFVIP